MPLVDISKPPTAENSVIVASRADNVAVARVPLSASQEVRVNGVRITIRQPVPAGHKVAIARVSAGETVRRYGEAIGRAACDIEAGNHVHLHNVLYAETPLKYEFPERDAVVSEPTATATFLGYPRPDGRAGTRNYIAVVALSNCAAHAVELAARGFENGQLPPDIDGIVALPHGEGCGVGTYGPDAGILRRTVRGLVNHPNVAAAVLVGLGCEVNQLENYVGANAARSGMLAGLALQSSGGTRSAVEAARRHILGFIEQVSGAKRVEVPASRLVLGLNCGGSDAFSGITANPALGVCSDLLVEAGGTAVLAETTEIFGAEHLLVRRARNRPVAEKILGFVRSYKEYLGRFEGTFDDNPSPGNKAGGLTNILEKSLGAIAKGGTSTLVDAVDYAESVESRGLVFMNTPGYDPVSLAGLAAGGVNVIAFTTGRGSAIGFPTVPVVKIASNSNTFHLMRDNMEVNAGDIADGERTVEEVGREIFDLLLRVASGERTASERLGHREFVLWRIGPVV